MRTVTAVVIASAMVLNHASAGVADTTTIDEMHHGGLTTGSMTQNPQSHMFDGIELTEEQRQQMRDLMTQARYERSPVSIGDIENMHGLITADTFNEAAIRAQAEKIAQAQIEQHVEMAHSQPDVSLAHAGSAGRVAEELRAAACRAAQALKFAVGFIAASSE